jgi:uncharacterized protein
MKAITIIKQNPAGEETWRYSGTVLKRDKNSMVVEAFFDREDIDFHGLCLCRGDRFVETYYFERWYNVFEIYDRQNKHLKGWYCNVSSPAIEKERLLIYRDLALDLLVFPDGRQIVLDEDEFTVLEISPREHKQALAALAELQVYFRDKLKAAGV